MGPIEFVFMVAIFAILGILLFVMFLPMIPIATGIASALLILGGLITVVLDVGSFAIYGQGVNGRTDMWAWGIIALLGGLVLGAITYGLAIVWEKYDLFPE